MRVCVYLITKAFQLWKREEIFFTQKRKKEEKGRKFQNVLKFQSYDKVEWLGQKHSSFPFLQTVVYLWRLLPFPFRLLSVNLFHLKELKLPNKFIFSFSTVMDTSFVVGNCTSPLQLYIYIYFLKGQINKFKNKFGRPIAQNSMTEEKLEIPTPPDRWTWTLRLRN